MSTALSPEVLCEFASSQEVIPSISIERILLQRDHAMNVLEQGLALVHEARKLMKEASDDKCREFTYIVQNGIVEGGAQSSIKRMKRQLDAGIWQRLMHDTGMITLMSHTQIAEWDKSLDTDKMPEATFENIQSSFEVLHQTKGQIFEKGVVDLFKKLSWDYKTNNPCKIGKKIIVNSMVGHYARNNCYYATDDGRNKLNDLEKMLLRLDGKNIPDHRVAAGVQFYDFTSENRWNGEKYEHEYFTVKYHKNRTGHILFKRPDLVEKLNDIICRHYPGALPSRV